ncbi:T-cell surface glycoprotein CD3 epsilon chain-like [Pempheris klunzingeri]|uniref:T-cell surface glycoprotein CD3 epsilon chain-like n=1 Tax=Pempheris klunzingeri TaxID=3127111 RepID=UPI0039812C58
MGVMAVLAILILFTATVKADPVTFWREDFTMACPDEGTFYKDKEIFKGQIYTHTYDNDQKGLYHCQYVVEEEDGDKKLNYYFYVKGKVCKNCFEVDAYVLGLVIVVDVIGTALIMVTIFKCTKKKSSAGLTHGSKAPPRSGGREPNDQSSHYEPLNSRTRSQDTYSVVNSRTG